MSKNRESLLKEHNDIFIELKTMKKRYNKISEKKSRYEDEMETLEDDFESLLETFSSVVEHMSREIGTSINE